MNINELLIVDKEVKPSSIIRRLTQGTVVLLLCSELLFIPFAQQALQKSTEIIFHLIHHPHLTAFLPVTIVVWSLAALDGLTLLFSVGDINHALKKLVTNFRSSKENDANPLLLWWQRISFMTIFTLGSMAAAEGLIEWLGENRLVYALAGYTFLGQLALILLQTQGRIVSSAANMTHFFRLKNKKSHLVNALNQPVILKMLLNTFCNISYRAARFYYIGYEVGHLFHHAQLLAPIACASGAYMVGSTQSLDELKSVYSTVATFNHEEEQSPEENKKTLSFLSVSTVAKALLISTWLYQSMTAIGFVYTFSEGDYDECNFNKTAACISVGLLPIAMIASKQYMTYMTTQVDSGLKAIANRVTDSFNFFKSNCLKKSSEHNPKNTIGNEHTK